jgi:hypothetical protein
MMDEYVFEETSNIHIDSMLVPPVLGLLKSLKETEFNFNQVVKSYELLFESCSV